MARGQIIVGDVSRAAATAVPTETTGDATNGHYCKNSPTTFLTVRNAHATLAKTVTVQIPVTVDGVTGSASKVYSIPATVTRDVGPFPEAKYGPQLLIDVESTDIQLIARQLSG